MAARSAETALVPMDECCDTPRVEPLALGSGPGKPSVAR